MNIHIVNEHLDMQANKLNAKYHLQVQYSIDALPPRQLHRGYKIQHGYKRTKDNAKHNLKVLNSYKAKVQIKHSLNN